MRNSSKNSEQTKNFLLTGADGGTVFTVAVMSSLIISFCVSLIFTLTGLSEDEQFTGSDLYTYLSFALSSLSLAIALFFSSRNLHFKYAVGFNKPSAKLYAVTALLFLGATFGLSGLNGYFIEFLQSFGYEVKSLTLPNLGVGNFIICTILVCVLPAFFEECIFRGLILNGARRLGDFFAVISVGVLFALFHKNPAQTLYQLVLGMIFTLLTIKGGSVIPAIIFHFANNFYVLIYHFATPEGYAFEPWLNVLLSVAGILCLLAALVWLLKIKKPEREQRLNEEYVKLVDVKKERLNFLLLSSVGVIACIVLWIANLVG